MYALLFNGSFLSLFIMNTLFLCKRQKFGYIALLISNIQISIVLGLRWLLSGYFPLSNLYESILFLTWCVTALQICFPFCKSEKANLPQKHEHLYTLMNQVTAPISLLLHAFASLKIPDDMSRIKPLVPALKSNWLIMHVSVMILSYAALLIGSVLSILYCFTILLGFSKKSIPFYALRSKWDTAGLQGYAYASRSNKADTSAEKQPYAMENQGNSADTLADAYDWQMIDSLSYQFISIGFPLLTLGIVSGSVWANEAWGSFWNWDIKETWSLITWLVYAIYIHCRLQLRWQGLPSSALASIGFFVVCICYIGVNLTGKGLHSYGWLTT